MKKINVFIFIGLVIFVLSPSMYARRQAKKIRYSVKLFPENAKILVDGKRRFRRGAILKLFLTKGEHHFSFSAPGYYSKVFKKKIIKPAMLEAKLEKKNSALRLLQEMPSGNSPKCVEFGPNGNYLFSALLRDDGIDVYSTWIWSKVARLKPPKKYAKKVGFVEIAFIKRKNEIWVSQMTANQVHVFDLKTFAYKTTFPSRGRWTKVILVDFEEKYAYVSNWLSHDISIFDIDTRKYLGKIQLNGVPRGMAFSEDGKYIYTAMFDTGELLKVKLSSKKIVKRLTRASGAKRHIVMDYPGKRMFVSDMSKGVILVFNLKNDRLIKTIRVGKKPNTIKYSAINHALFVSCRGPNKPGNYLVKGPRFGKIYVIDTKTLKKKEWIWGKNQPTGLDVSPGGTFLAFSDFLDANIEVYAYRPANIKNQSANLAIKKTHHKKKTTAN